MGTADIIPGVSGGTMAFILGIYGRLLDVIRAVNWDLVRHIQKEGLRTPLCVLQPLFIGPLLLGIVAAIVIMVKVVGLPDLLHSHPEPVYGLFFGLIAGSIWVLLNGDLPQSEKHRLHDMLEFVIGVAFGLFVVTLVPTETPDAQWFYFICGVLAISAMLLPGVSGSFILLILGKYATILGAISDMDLFILMPFAFGCGVGLALFARIIGYYLEHHRRRMILVICGILTGTLYAIWPFQDRVYDIVRHKERLVSTSPMLPESFVSGEAPLAFALMFLGVALVLVIEKLSKKSED